MAALHEVGHADAVVEEKVAGVAVAGDHAGGERGRPEAVPRPGEPHAGVGRVQAGVEPADQEPHTGADDVGQGAAAAHEHVEPLVAGPVVGAQVDDVEAGPGEDVLQLVGVPSREEPSRELVAGEWPFALTPHHREVGGRVDREGVVQLHQRPRQPVARHVQIARPRPRAAERAPPERQRLEVAPDARYVGRGVARELDHRRGRIERDRGAGQIRKVQPGATPEIGNYRTGAHRVAEEDGTIEEPRLAAHRATRPPAPRTPPRCRDPSP